MSYSYVTYSGNGSTKSYAIPFPYISVDHIQVSLNGINTTAWSLSDPGTLLLASAPASGGTIAISRNTPLASPLVVFSDTSTLTETDLGLSELQLLYCTQESSDKADRNLASVNMNTDAVSNKVDRDIAAERAYADTVRDGARAYTDTVRDGAHAYTDAVRASLEPLAGLSPTTVGAALTAIQSKQNTQDAQFSAQSAQLSAQTTLQTAQAAAQAAQATQITALDNKRSATRLGVYAAVGGYITIPTPPGYRFYRLHLMGLTTTVSAYLYMRFSIDGGASFRAAENDYSTHYLLTVGSNIYAQEFSATHRQISGDSQSGISITGEIKVDARYYTHESNVFTFSAQGAATFKAEGATGFAGPITHIVVGAVGAGMAAGEVLIEGYP